LKLGRGVRPAPFILLAAVLLSAPRPTPAAAWHRLASPRIELLTDAREADARRVLRELEIFRAVAERFLRLTNRAAVPVFYFGGEGALEPYRPRLGGHVARADGFHTVGEGGAALAFHREDTRAGTIETAYHEYTHLLTQRAFAGAPLWLHEGVAVALSTFETRGERATIGRVHEHSARLAATGGLLPLAGLVAGTAGAPDLGDVTAAARFYASAWALTHFLLFAEDGARAGLAPRLAAALAGTTNQAAAFTQVTGLDPPTAEARVTAMLRGGRHRTFQTTFSRPGLEGLPWERLSDAEVDYRLGSLLRLVGRHEAAMERLARAAAARPDDPRPPAELGFAHLAAGRTNEARLALERAAQLGSTNGAVHARLAWFALGGRGLRLGPGVTAEEVGAALRRVDLAEAHGAEEAAVAYLRALASLRAHPRAPALAVPHVRRALALDPQHADARLLWALLLAAGGDREGARRELAALLATPAGQRVRPAALALARELEQAPGGAVGP
jgi:tetratricopeptide (TPR) repeat protein